MRGDVPPGAADTAVAKLRAACGGAPRPILFARLTLTMAADPAVERPALAGAAVDVNGRVVRAHAASPTMNEAVDLLADRVRRGIRQLHEEDLC